jgi:hypothetical protein
MKESIVELVGTGDVPEWLTSSQDRAQRGIGWEFGTISATGS